MLTHIAAVRSAAEIMTDYPDLPADRRASFLSIVHDESRALTDVLDRVDLMRDYDPVAQYKLVLPEAQLDPEELAAVRGEPVPEPPEVPEDEAPPASSPKPPHRLDG